MKHKGIAVSLAILIACCIAEIAVRAYRNHAATGILTDRPVVELYPGIEHPEEVFSLFGPENLDWSPYEHWITRPNLRSRFYRTNALGFRGPETTVEKPAGRYRIVVLGGSVAWGYGSTADDRTVPGRLQALLRERFPGRDIEVINAAQIGFVSGQQVVYFHRVVQRLSPDLVLFFDGYNDVAADFLNPVSGWPQNAALLKARYQASWRARSSSDELEALARRSSLVDFLWTRFLPQAQAVSRGPADGGITAAETAQNYVRNVQGVAALASPAHVCVVLQPTLATARKPLSPGEKQVLARENQQVPNYTQRVQEACAAMKAEVDSARIPRIELNGALGNEPELLFADECHFGDTAAERIAGVIAEELGEMIGPALASRPNAARVSGLQRRP
jgi:lysophospholipase L1-like esterase